MKWTRVPRFLLLPLLEFTGGLALGVSLLPGETRRARFPDQFFTGARSRSSRRRRAGLPKLCRSCCRTCAGVQRGHDDLRGGNFFAVDIHVVDRNAASVVDHGDGIVKVNGDFDLVGVSGERFVNGVVNDFVNEVMQTHFSGRADVHGGRLRTASMPPRTLMESAV